MSEPVGATGLPGDSLDQAEATVARATPGQDAEDLRWQYVGRERAMRWVALVFDPLLLVFGVGLFSVLAEVASRLSGLENKGPIPGAPGLELAILATILFALTVATALIGWGFRRLRHWARWFGVLLLVLVELGLLAFAATAHSSDLFPGNAFGGALCVGLIGVLWVLLSPRTGVIFSARYREAVAQTPHYNTRAPWPVRLIRGFFALIMLISIVVALLAVGVGLFT